VIEAFILFYRGLC